MAVLNKKTMKKSAYRRKKYTRKVKKANLTTPSLPLQILNNSKPKVIRLKRSILSNQIVQTSGTGVVTTSGVSMVRLADFPAVADFTSLFSYYKINKLKISWRLANCPADGTIYPTIYSWKNMNPAAIAFTGPQLNQIQRVHKYQTSSDDRGFTHSFIPYNLDVIYNGTNNANQIQYNAWQSMTDTSVQYFGLAYFIENFGQSGNATGDIQLFYDIEADISFKMIV